MCSKLLWKVFLFDNKRTAKEWQVLIWDLTEMSSAWLKLSCKKALGSTWLNLGLKSNEQCLVEAKTNHRQLNLRLFTADSDMQNNCYHAVQRLYFMQVTIVVYIEYDYRRKQDNKGRQLLTRSSTPFHQTRVHFKLYIRGCLSSPTSIAHYQRSRGSNI